MPKKVLPRIVSVAHGKKALTLRVHWNTGDDTLVDVSGLINSFRLYAPLRENPNLFGKVRVGEHGADVVWSDELDISNDTLWRLAQEQSGATMNAEAFRRWRERRAYTLDAAAKALGVSRRMIAYYEKGERPIPRVVALATRALEAAE
ncbi:MAG TPA: helix-turn-helix domain-containing protein [Stellaceae bacterium]|nr:helix-turn-helix domain-containing protein [Stellaceae bacterium]